MAYYSGKKSWWVYVVIALVAMIAESQFKIVSKLFGVVSGGIGGLK